MILFECILILSAIITIRTGLTDDFENFNTQEDEAMYGKCNENAIYVLIKTSIGLMERNMRLDLNCIQSRLNKLLERQGNDTHTSNLTNIEDCAYLNTTADRLEHHLNNTELTDDGVTCLKEKIQRINEQLNPHQFSWIFLDNDYEKCSLVFRSVVVYYEPDEIATFGLKINLDCFFNKILQLKMVLGEDSMESLLLIAEVTYKALQDNGWDDAAVLYKPYRECVRLKGNETERYYGGNLIRAALFINDECLVSIFSGSGETRVEGSSDDSENFNTQEEEAAYGKCNKENTTYVLLKESYGINAGYFRINLNCIQSRFDKLIESQGNDTDTSNFTNIENIEDCAHLNTTADRLEHHLNNTKLTNDGITCLKEKIQRINEQLNEFQFAWIFLDNDYEECKLEFGKKEVYYELQENPFGLNINLDCFFDKILHVKTILGEDSIKRLLLVAEFTYKILQENGLDDTLVLYKPYRECVRLNGNETIRYYRGKMIRAALFINVECVVSTLRGSERAIAEDHVSSFLLLKYIQLPLNIVSIALNSLVLVVFCKVREMRTPANMYLVSLSVAFIYKTLCDVGFNTCAIICETYRFEQEDVFQKCNNNSLYYGMLFGGFEMYIIPFTLAAMSLDRYFSIKKSMNGPSTSSQRMRKRNALFYIMFTWILAASFHACDAILILHFHVMGKADYLFSTYIVFVRFVVPFTVIIVTSIQTSKLLRRAARNCPGENQAKQREARVKSARIITAMALNHFFCYFGIYVFDIVSAYSMSDAKTFIAIRYAASIPPYIHIINTILNPVILYLCSPIWRDNVNKIICCRK